MCKYSSQTRSKQGPITTLTRESVDSERCEDESAGAKKEHPTFAVGTRRETTESKNRSREVFIHKTNGRRSATLKLISTVEKTRVAIVRDQEVGGAIAFPRHSDVAPPREGFVAERNMEL